MNVRNAHLHYLSAYLDCNSFMKSMADEVAGASSGRVVALKG